jgi:hypothetical protein
MPSRVASTNFCATRCGSSAALHEPPIDRISRTACAAVGNDSRASSWRQKRVK